MALHPTESVAAAFAVLEMERVPVIVNCLVSNAVTHPEMTSRLVCSQRGLLLHVVLGEELRAEYIECKTETERLR